MVTWCQVIQVTILYLVIVTAQTDDLVTEGQENENQDNTRDIQNQLKAEGIPKKFARQKRWHNSYGFGFPTLGYPGFSRHDEANPIGTIDTGAPSGDPFVPIIKQLEEIAGLVRQPLRPAQQPVQLPIFIPYPFLLIPQGSCTCTPVQPSPGIQNPTTGPNTQDGLNTPSSESRFPQLDDSRMNWGLVTNNSQSNVIDDEAPRPVNFTPQRPSRPINRVPPVDHGTTQGGTPIAAQQSGPQPIPQQPPPRPLQQGPAASPPTACDVAVLSCCHQAQPTVDCFANLGCPNTASGSPCDPRVVSAVLDVFQRFYSQITF